MIWRRGIAVAIAIIVACLIVLGFARDFLVDWSWFSSLGFAGIFWTIVAAKWALFAVVFVATAALLWLNGAVAVRFAASRTAYLRPVPMPWDSLVSTQLPALIERFMRRLPWRLLVAAAALIVAVLVAAGSTNYWNLALNYLFQAPYGHSDPLFGNDFSFYLFALPLFVALKDWLLLVLVLATLIAAAVYWACGRIVFAAQRRFVSTAAAMHGSILLGALLRDRGMVVLARPLSAPLRRQRRRRRRKLHRCASPAADPHRACRALLRRRHCLLRQCAAAFAADCARFHSARLRNLVAGSRRSPPRCSSAWS